MGLELINATYQDTKIDIICIPAIGSDANDTFRFPGSPEASQQQQQQHHNEKSKTGPNGYWAGPHYRSLFQDVRQARVYHWDYPMTVPGGKYAIGYYAEMLLEDIKNTVGEDEEHVNFSDKRPRRKLHFVGHSTGGMVIKLALVLARESEDPGDLDIAERCFSCAFFGTPHGGSTILSETIYQKTVQERLGMRFPMDARTLDFLSPGNAEQLDELTIAFAPLALGLRKVFAFVERRDTKLKVLTSHVSGETEQIIRLPIVDMRSARVGTDESPIGSEEVVTVDSDHAKLCRFGDNHRATAYVDYIEELRSLIAGLAPDDGQDLSWIDQKVKVDIHLFYEGGNSPDESMIKLWSAKPSFQMFARKGPTACLNQRLHDVQIVPQEDRAPSRRSSVGSARYVSPMIMVSPPEAEEKHNDGLMLQPGLQQRKTFDERLADVPALIHHDDSDEELQSPIISTRRGSTGIMGPLPALQNLTKNEAEHSLREMANRQSHHRRTFQLPDVERQRFKWIHVPVNNMQWVRTAMQSITEEKARPELLRSLLNGKVWNNRQNIPRHGVPHGRFMDPICKALWPHMSRRGSDARVELDLESPSDQVQMLLYLPYLHWDTFGNLKRRNETIQRRMAQPRPFPVDEEVATDHSLEHKLIWQYIKSDQNLPLHHRRSLDQYGYPTLRSTASRDADQVMYKRTRPSSDNPYEMPRAHTFHHKGSRIAHALTGKKTASKHERLRQEKETMIQRLEEESKVLLVDQLWLWIIDNETVLTFFPGNEQSKQADLRDAIYNDVNGDPRFATQCRDCFDFACLVILHTVTVFLNHMKDKDLQVFRIFEEYISILTERQTNSFKEFRNSHQKHDFIHHTEDALFDNSQDLTGYLELCDVEDELKTLEKLFDEQAKVLALMFDTYKSRKLPNSPREKELQTINEARGNIGHYKKQVLVMLHNCRAAQSAYNTLLDMKQKQANVDEAWLSRRSTEAAAAQGRSIMVFTIFTIIFLPLSFFTSLFGMNVEQWSGVSTNPKLHTVVVFMAAISAGIVVVALLLAFNRPVRGAARALFADSWRRIPPIRRTLSIPLSAVARHNVGDMDLESGPLRQVESKSDRWFKRSKYDRPKGARVPPQPKKIDMNGKVKTNTD